MEALISGLVSLGVATITALSSIAVAKINKMQKSIKTNHNTSSLGEAIDLIHEKTDLLIKKQKNNDIIHEILEDEIQLLRKQKRED